MLNKESYKRIIKRGFSSVILLAEAAIYYYIWLVYCNPILKEPFFRKGNWLIAAVYLCFLSFLHTIYGGLKIYKFKTIHLIYSHTFTLVICNLVAYCQMSLIDKRFHEPYYFLILTLLEIIIMFVWIYVCYYIYKYIFPPRRLVVVTGERPIFHMIGKMILRDDKYIVDDVVNIDKGIDEVFKRIGRYDGVIIGDIEAHERNLVLKHCYDINMRVYTVPKISDILIRSADELNLFDTPFLVSSAYGMQVEQMIIKRFIDIFGSIFLIIITSPIMIITTLLIKLSDNGPVFYTQDRLTQNGKVFKIIKFRTMRTDAESDGVARLAGKRDERVSKFGRFLRSTRIDELPQLINILKGDMSIVGPRPERPEIAEQYEKLIPEFRFRLKMKAGLTGYAQIYGKYNTTPFDKLKLDLTYIRNYSLWMDLKLILMTPKVVFMKDSSEGVSDGEITAMSNMEDVLKEKFYGENIELKNDFI